MDQQFEELRRWLLSHKAIDPSVQDAHSIRRLDLSHLGLKEIPESIGLLSELIILNLANNNLSTLPQSMFQLGKLSNLDLRRNAFTAVPPVLLELPISAINLSTNEISDVSRLFALKSLRVCDVSFNHISSVNTPQPQCEDLRTLNLSGNYLKEVPECIEHLENLERLNLSQNRLQALTSSCASLGELRELNLADNEIAHIDEAFFSLHIEDLDLSVNKLQELTLHGLSDLEVMSLDENPLTQIEVEEDFAPYLREFSCDSCHLDRFVELPSEVIESLCFSSNNISRIPKCITKYQQLKQLDIDDNNITNLPYGMTNMTRLQTLYIKGNPLSDGSKEIIDILHPDICDIKMKSGIVIEEASERDLTQMADLIGQLFKIEKDFQIDFQKQLSGITKLYFCESSDLLVARYEGKVVGMVTMQRLISSAAGDYVGQIEDLVVDEAYRKMGIGSRLINKIRFIALEEHGYKRVQLGADMDNVHAQQFYTRRGFSQTNLHMFHLNK